MLKTVWSKLPIEKLCLRVTSGGTPSRLNSDFYTNGTIPWIKTGDLSGWYVDDIEEFITEDAVAQSSAKVFPAETVLFAMYGDGRTMGTVGIIRQPAATNQACCAMIPDLKKCDPKFLLYSLRYYKPALLQLAISGAQRNLNGKTIKSFEIGAPDLAIQCRIASILSAYDALIENNTRRFAILEEMARRLYDEWFIHFRFPGHEQVRMVESELGLIPDGWNVIRVGAAFTTVLGGTPSRGKPEYWDGGTVPWINSGKVNELRVLEPSELITDLALKKSATKLMPRGTTLLAITGATLGQVSILCEEMCANQSVVGIVDPTGLHSEYIYRTIQAHIAEIILHASGGAQQHINKEVVNDVLVLQPDIETLKAFNVIAIPMGQMISTLMKKNANLRAQRDLLLPKLISGEIDVSAFPEAEAVAA